MNVEGKVSKYYVDGPKQSRKGAYYVHSIYVNESRYSAFGKKADKLAQEGDVVSFEASENGDYMNFDAATFKVVSSAPAAPAAAATTPAGYSRDASIARQNALRHAVAVMCADMENNQLSPQEMAQGAVALAYEVFYPYIETGLMPSSSPAQKKDTKKTDDDELPF
jgi:hypothetical protein